MIRLYLESAKCEVKRMLQYKANSLFYLTVVLIPPLALFFLWKTILSHGGSIGGYNLSDMVTYFIVTQFFVMNTPYSAWIEIGESIKDGSLSLWLVKPVNHYLLYLFRLIGSWIIQWIFGIAGVIVVSIILKDYVVIPKEASTYFLSILFWMGGIVIGFSYGYILNLLSFWFERSTYIIYFSEGIVALLSGMLIPLDLLPAKSLWLFLPFKFCGYVPAQIFLGKMTGLDIAFEFASMAIWIFVLVSLSHLVFKIGSRRFTASGG